LRATRAAFFGSILAVNVVFASVGPLTGVVEVIAASLGAGLLIGAS